MHNVYAHYGNLKEISTREGKSIIPKWPGGKAIIDNGTDEVKFLLNVLTWTSRLVVASKSKIDAPITT